ncbi:MAG: ACT domain-containing protein [Oscillospiraceae bacterium]|nr:ACT domain-containing protein [Oscillospiraceae bacterium]MBR2976993.1 ACT domain-containing protein [Oscillospiraceae bacterium]
MKAFVTVMGPDRIGIIAEVTTLLRDHSVNVLDINQTVMQGYFTMTMLVDTSASEYSFDTLRDALLKKGEEMRLSIRIQREDIFNAMHQI